MICRGAEGFGVGTASAEGVAFVAGIGVAVGVAAPFAEGEAETDGFAEGEAEIAGVAEGAGGAAPLTYQSSM